MLAPARTATLLVNHHHREVRHEACRGGPVPVVFTRLEEHAIAGSYDFRATDTPANASDAFGHPDVLSVRMRVPRRPCARREVNVARVQPRRVGGSRHWVDVHIAGEPLGRALGGAPVV